MKDYKCKNCGAPLKKQGDNYVCEYCKHTYQDDSIKASYEKVKMDMQQTMQSVVSEELLIQKMEKISNRRRSLYSVRKSEFIDNDEVKYWADELLKLVPDDIQATFYSLAARENWSALNAFMANLNGEEVTYLVEDFVEFLTNDRFVEKCMLQLTDLIARTFKENSKEYENCHKRITDASERDESGIFDTSLARDVFVAYSSKDKEKVYELVEYLEEREISCFVAMRNLPKGINAQRYYNERLKQAIDNCQVFLLVSSKNSRSKNCDAYSIEMQYVKESDLALSDDQNYYNNHYETYLEDYRDKCKPRVQWLLEGYGESIYENWVKKFFSGLTWCTNKNEVVNAVEEIITNRPCAPVRKVEIPNVEEIKTIVEEVTPVVEEVTPVVEETMEVVEEIAVTTEMEETSVVEEVVEVETTEEVEEVAPVVEETTQEGKELAVTTEEVTEASERSIEEYSLEDLLKLAEKGNAIAQSELGIRYYDGNGVTQDYKKAVEWFTKSAEQGYAEAQNNLGVCYNDGLGVKKNAKTAVEWYKKAVEQGDDEAHNNLGMCYFRGEGVAQDYKKAVELFTKIAKQGHATAQNNLAYSYENGLGVEQNYKKAVEWYTKSAEQGNAGAQYSLGDCYYNGNGVKENFKKAVEWYTKSAEQGYVDAQNSLGVCYYNGIGVTQNYKKAVEWFRKAVKQGHAAAQNNLGSCYCDGLGVEINLQKGVELYKKAADQGYAEAQYRLGVYYEYSTAEKDNKKAKHWYVAAAEQGHQGAISKINSLKFKFVRI